LLMVHAKNWWCKL